jgi:aspartate aminotransferase/aminotransferase
MTGWRLGYAAARAVISQMTKLQQYTFVCPPSPLQYAALAALGRSDGRRRRGVPAQARHRRSTLSAQVRRRPPGGAFYIFPSAPKRDRDEFVQGDRAQRAGHPGNVFSERDTHFRISYATTDEKLARGCDILCSLASS